MITKQEFESILADTSKRIEGDIVWHSSKDGSPVHEFRVTVESNTGWPLIVVGKYNPLAGTLSYAVLHRLAGRIYSLDLGADHHNPNCQRVGEKHKHRWSEEYRDKIAYVASDISATWDQPVAVWMEFCQEAGITHQGVMRCPAVQGDLPL